MEKQKKKKVDRRVQYTKMVLRQSFIDLLEKYPISKITIKSICEKADINRTTFYAHYADQYDLLNQIKQELIDDVHVYLANFTFHDNKSESVQLLNKIFEYIKENSKICSVLLNDTTDTAFYEQIMAIVQNLCMEQLTKKTFNQNTVDYIISFAATGSIGLIRKWLDTGMKEPTYTMAEIILKLTNQGLTAFV